MHETVVEMALSDARRVLEQTGSFRLLIGIEGGGSIHWLDVPASMDLHNANVRELIANAAPAGTAATPALVVLVHDASIGVPTKKQEALVVSVQTAETATMAHQKYERTTDGIVWGERTAYTVRQSEFSGRLKMFGEGEGKAKRKPNA